MTKVSVFRTDGGFSVPRCRSASDGIFDRFQLLCFFFLTPDTRHLTPDTYNPEISPSESPPSGRGPGLVLGIWAAITVQRSFDTEIKNIAPWSFPGSAQTRPLWRSAISLTMANPSPAPSTALEVSSLRNAAKSPS